jgi:hypothetical protein
MAVEPARDVGSAIHGRAHCGCIGLDRQRYQRFDGLAAPYAALVAPATSVAGNSGRLL